MIAPSFARRAVPLHALLLVAIAIVACGRGAGSQPDPDGRFPAAGAPLPLLADQAEAVVEPYIPPAAPLTEVIEPSARFALPVPWALAPRATTFAEAPPGAGLAAVVVDEASGAVLYAKNAEEPLPPASLTKIATAILAIEHGGLDEVVETDVDSNLMPTSTIMGLHPTDRFTVRDLLYGLMLPSGNDAALALARHVSGSDAAFVSEMNGLLYRLGMDSSHFANPHGLGGRSNLITATDLALLARYAMQLPEFRAIVATPYYVANGSRRLAFGNINAFAFTYPGADGIKTGYTRSAGHTLVASATRNGHRLYAVVLNSPQKDADAAALLNWAFANHAWPGP